ncbi:aldo/keto reductase [Streptomyces sp. NPDC088560]|uniref:aldo/keto reductase n=1 Tax=Streptomyces sp. NPDC088560 TaxID=3365868 RepID=UPI003820F27F
MPGGSASPRSCPTCRRPCRRRRGSRPEPGPDRAGVRRATRERRGLHGSAARPERRIRRRDRRPGLDSAEEEFLAVHPISAVQTEYSLWERHVENGILPALRGLGAALVAYSPLGRGLLTGAVRATTHYERGDFRATAPRYNGDDLQANLAIVDAITLLAAAKSATPAQIALAWLLTRGSDVIPIPGGLLADLK